MDENIKDIFQDNQDILELQDEQIEAIEEEIYNYYKNNGDEDSTEPCDKKQGEILFYEEEPETEEFKIKKSVDWSKKSFYILFSLFGFCIILSVYFIGRANPLNSQSAVVYAQQQKLSDNQYVDAKILNDDLKAEIEDLKNQKVQKESKLGELSEFEKKRDEAKEKAEELKTSLEEKNNEISEKQKELEQIQSDIDKKINTAVTLSPGVYTVGKHIPAGKYSVVGGGGMAVADDGNKSKINTTLSTNPYECRLNDGDIIKLQTKAKFVPDVG